MDPKTVEKLETTRDIYLTTKGRKTGRPHMVEIWYEYHDGKIYLAAGLRGKTDWAKNIARDSNVSIRISGVELKCRASLQEDDASSMEAKRLWYTKYYGEASDNTINDWYKDYALVTIEIVE